MREEDYPIAITLAAARVASIPAGRRSAELMTHGTMRLLYYAPRDVDRQKPHDQDELYVVASGTGTFLCGARRAGFVPGDVLFAPAGVVHRFETFSEDFAVWVIFYGPKGGEGTLT